MNQSTGPGQNKSQSSNIISANMLRVNCQDPENDIKEQLVNIFTKPLDKVQFELRYIPNHLY